MILRSPLFQGATTEHQLMCILQVIGTMDLEKEYQEPYDFLNLFVERCPTFIDDFPNLLVQMLQFRDLQRPTAHQLLGYEYFRDIRMVVDSAECSRGLFSFQVEDEGGFEEAMKSVIQRLID